MFFTFFNLIFAKDIQQKEKAENITSLLNLILNIIRNFKNDVSNSNFFVFAIDKREFNPFFIHNAFRRNDGNWCDFIYIDGINSPRAKDSSKWNEM